MDVAVLTVGDELLSGDIENTNASWLARQLAERGATVPRILTVPDDAAVIESTVREWHDAYDAVFVTGGLGGTHDDVTMDAVAAAFGRELVLDDAAAAHVEEKVRTYRERNPDLAEDYPDIAITVEDWAAVPQGARPLLVSEALSPGCVVESVYVTPGVPEEMRAMFALVADEFGGAARARTLYTPAPEGAVVDVLADARDAFDVSVGSYPAKGAETHNRVTLRGTDEGELDRAESWLRAHLDVVDA
ncbi:MAG: competence/damage-inducible protein A [Halobacteriaceae archaeon]